ncbi:uncharacterized protein LOC117792750 [Drosophila innubila]|uniref:uncharacterized protein LOC117792750 n=1 Tax=Drosophila innubila TaxID=198719 RepID=UPI00148CFBFA|nr:uncharacterized protein LOC117792750 [Drosophila innubila]
MRCCHLIQLLGQLSIVSLVLAFADSNRTELNHVVERVFSRQKRFVLFPKGSNLKFTGSMSKGLLSKFPKGVSMNIEQACYFPVPSSREDVYPKRFRPRTTTTPAPLTTTEPTYVWIAGTDWRFKATPLKKPMPLKLHQRIDHRPHVDPAKWKQYGQQYKDRTPANKYAPGKSGKYGQQYQNWNPADKYEKKYKNWMPAERYKEPGKWSKWTTVSPHWSNYGKRWHRSAEDQEPYDPEIADYEAVHYPDLSHLTSWRHYHGHRDRRQLFEQFGAFTKLLGIDMKACILRAICDSKRLLLPPGYSMLQDIVRLIFTMPTISGVEDDYSRIMRMDSEDCDRQFRDQCKLDILAWLLGLNKTQL